ncbi:proline dehydrogenase family protein [Salsipaludibacter albus]|uniref:proline dehydrogenase family protein n=1 Tax=Salsipaludibacter albus TaxID=2849650 RepID=UPI001EE3B25D|nr:proline dehydrogenase family protein [Salsipaludibacter albus]
MPPAREPEALVDDAVALAGRWLDAADASETASQRRQREQFQRLIGSHEGVAFTRVFVDRVMRVEDDDLAAEVFHDLVATRGLPDFLAPTDKALVRAGATVAPWLPRVVMPLAQRRVRAMLSDLIGRAEPAPLKRQLQGLRDRNFRVNVNLLGEAVLGEDEAQRRLASLVELLGRPEVDYVSVKISAVASQLHHWAFDANLDRITDRLVAMFAASIDRPDPVFVNLDMEEYRDLDLTVAAFKRVLERDEFAHLDAGIVLQAYLPDAGPVLDDLLDWAAERHAAAGGRTKIRLVKGANLAMEHLEAATHGWTPAPLPSKAVVDANYKHLLDLALRPDRLGPAWIGVASHNLFDLALADLLAAERGVSDDVVFEMLSGMASAQAAVIVRHRPVRLYLPVVGSDDFDAAVAYLFRRLEENTAPENFLTKAFSITSGSDEFLAQADRFRTAVADRGEVAQGSRRWTGRPDTPEFPTLPLREGESEPAATLTPIAHPIAPTSSGVDDPGFVNRPDADPTDPDVRAALVAAITDPPTVEVAAPPTVADVDAAVERLAAADWHDRDPDARADVLEAVADALDAHRADLVGVMAADGAKTIEQSDPEVSEAADFARYYADCARRLGDVDGATFTPYRVVAVTPPWNFPLAIPVGGVLASLAAGATVAFKPAPETRAVAALAHRIMVDAGVPDDAVVFLPTDDDEAGRRLVTHDHVDAVVLTGATETAELFRSWRDDLHLHAETSGKNALVVTPNADFDAAVHDLVTSAFGHAGQKCSAASLAILVGDVATSSRFRRQLVDATNSLTVGPADDVATDMTPTTPAPSDKLLRGLTRLEPGERWLVEPRQLDDSGHLWSPGIRDRVEPGSWFHETECFGPVLGIIAVSDLDEAIAVQNAVAFGLTGGIHSLDRDEVTRWLDGVEVGNAYVNRHITGAIVRRQPFGGWKASVVGPGAKAGGPQMVPSLGAWHDDGLPSRLHDVSAAVDRIAGVLRDHAKSGDGATDHDAAWLTAATGSDAWWWAHEFGVAHDPTGLATQSNVLRYRPLPSWMVRVGAGGADVAVVRALCAAVLADVPTVVSVAEADDRDGPGVAEVVRRAVDQAGPRFTVVVEDTVAATERAGSHARVQLVGERDLGALPVGVHVEHRPLVASGRVVLPRLLREQAISHDVHRFGHVARPVTP